MKSYSVYKLKIAVFILLINLAFAGFAGFQFSFWEYDLNPILNPILISLGLSILVSFLVIIIINSMIGSVEEDISLFKEKSASVPIDDLERKLHRINIFVYVYSIFIWLIIIPIVYLIINKDLFSGEFFMRCSFFIPIGLILAPIQVIIINNYLTGLKKSLKIYKLKGVSKSGLIKRRILLMVFIPVFCITFGLNYNYDNMLKASEEAELLNQNISNLTENQIINQIEELQNNLNSNMKNSFLINMIMGLLLIGFSSIFLFTSNTEVRQRLKSLFNRILSFTQEDKNLIQKVEITGNDEIGEISEKINEYIENQRNNIDYLKSMHHTVSTGLSDIQIMVDSLNSVSIDFDSFSTESKTTKEKAKHSLDKTKNYIEDICNSITDINQNLNNQVIKMEYSTDIIGETLGGLSQITSESKKAMEYVSNVLSKSEQGSKAMSEHIKVMSELSEYSEGVVEIVEAINSIVKKTNLLAMNASIEAAHAGDAGKGFSVVAQEIRNLAETSSHNIKEITERMRSVAEKIDLSSQTINIAGKSFKSIFSGIKQINSTFNNISSNIKKQEDNTREISHSINELTDSVINIKSLSDKQNEKSKDILNIKDDLNGLSENLNKEQNMVEDNVNTIKNNIEELKKVTSKNQQIINNLNEYSNKYITEYTGSTKRLQTNPEENKNITTPDD